MLLIIRNAFFLSNQKWDIQSTLDLINILNLHPNEYSR